MLTLLQYLAILAAFFLPWTIGGTVKFHKEGNARKRGICVLALAGCILLLAVTGLTAAALHA